MFKNFSTYALEMMAPQYEQIEMALTHGFRGIDLDVVDMAEQFELRGEAKARRLLDSAKIHLGSFELPVPLEGSEEEFQQELEKLSTRAEVAARLGCLRARVVLKPWSETLPMHENFEQHRKRLQQAAGVLQGYNIRLALGFSAPAVLRQDKPHEFIHTLEQLTPLVEMIPGAGYVIDLWDITIGGGSLEAVKALPPEKILVVHVCDGPTEKPPAEWTPEDRHLPGSTGVLDLVGLLTYLKEIDYQGPVSPLVSKALTQGQRRDEVAHALGQALEGLWQQAGLSPLAAGSSTAGQAASQ